MKLANGRIEHGLSGIEFAAESIPFAGHSILPAGIQHEDLMS